MWRKKLASIFLCLGIFLPLIQIQTSTTYASDCPQNWGLKEPNLNFTIYDVDIDGKKGTKQRYYISSLPTNIERMTGDTFASSTFYFVRFPMPGEKVVTRYFSDLFDKAIVEKLKNLASNVEISANYISSTVSPVQNLDHSKGIMFGDWLEIFSGLENSAMLRMFGINNGTELTYRVNISVKGCGPFVIDSNTYTFTEMLNDEIGVDAYYELFSSLDSFGRRLSYLQLDEAKRLLLDNISTISSSIDLDDSIPLKVPELLVSDTIQIIFVGLEPAGCIDTIRRATYNTNPRSVKLSQTPCKVGVYGMYPNMGLSGLTLVTSFLAPGGQKAKAEAEAKAKAEAKASAVMKKTTITCVKGKLTKRLTAKNPKCPAGYKKK